MSTLYQFPDRTTARGRVAAEVRAAMARVRLSGSQLGRLTGKSQAYWSRRITGDVAFDVDDLETIAGYVGVEVGAFFGAGDSKSPHPDGPGGGEKLPRLDSNQQPFGYTPPQVTSLTDRRARRSAAIPERQETAA